MKTLSDIELATLALLSRDVFRVDLFGMDGTPAQLMACRSLARAGLAEWHRGVYRITAAGRAALKG